MNDINYRVSLDMFDVQSQTTIKAKKGDSACKINITLTKHGKIYKIGEGCYATFNAKKSDGNFIYDNCTIEGDTIVYDFKSSIDENGTCQVTACEGSTECEVTLYKDSEQLTSPRFTLAVDGTVYNGEEIASTPESNVLRELINEANETVNEIETKLENGEFNGKDAVTDQSYSATSENAQSGKAVAEAVEQLMPKVLPACSEWYDQILVIKDIQHDENGELSYKYSTFPIDQQHEGTSGGLEEPYCIPIRNYNACLTTNYPSDKYDCTNKAYVDGLVGDIETLLGGI